MYDPEGKYDKIITEKEKLFDRVSHERLIEFINNRKNKIVDFKRDSNSYGEFLFVTLQFPQDLYMTFYGAGFDDNRDKYILDYWRFYDGSKKEGNFKKKKVLSEIETERKNLEALTKDHKQSLGGKIFSIVADLTDEDGAIAEFDDQPNLFDLYEKY